VNGLAMAPLVEGGDVVEALGERVLGRVVAEDIVKPGAKEVLIATARCSTRRCKAARDRGYRPDQGALPDHLPDTLWVCASCYGPIWRAVARFPSARPWVSSRHSQSANPAHSSPCVPSTSVARPPEPHGQQCGSAQQGPDPLPPREDRAAREGPPGRVSRSGELGVWTTSAAERERYKLPYGAVINAKEGAMVAGGQVVATWDPHTIRS